jgi:hypothetical protein
MRKYWRVTFLAANGKRRHVWATDYNDPGAGKLVRFFVVDKEGDEPEPREMVISTPGDIVRLRQAVMSNMYGWLEVVDGKS